MNPRQFVTESNNYLRRAVYSVAPFANGKCLDLPFHIHRLWTSFDVNMNPASAVIWPFLVEMDKGSQLPVTSSGLLTVCFGESIFNGELEFRSFWSYDQSPFKKDTLVDVDVQLFQRKIPQVKDCRWPIERRVLESNRPCWIGETLLSRPDGSITEGLVSNVFCVDEQDRIITTASPSTCLSGSMSRLVRATCSHMEVPVCYSAVDLKAETVDGAFLTSATKPITGISSVLFRSTSGTDEEIRRFKPSPLMLEIRSTLLRGLETQDPNFLAEEIPYELWWDVKNDRRTMEERMDRMIECVKYIESDDLLGG